MRQDLCDVTLVVDRSGSMGTIKQEAESGINAFIDEQKANPGECLFTLVHFDTEYEFVHKGVPIKQVGPYTLKPRGMTALLDAVGRAINETGQRLEAIPEDQRPLLVAFVIVTDGEENSSHEFTKARIKSMIEEQQNQYSWRFTFLGANQDAFEEARSLGIAASGTAQYSPQNAAAAFRSASKATSAVRCCAMTSGSVGQFSYSDEDRDGMA